MSFYIIKIKINTFKNNLRKKQKKKNSVKKFSSNIIRNKLNLKTIKSSKNNFLRIVILQINFQQY